jgi:DNA-binding GntR family transcriptional regulator
MKKSDLSKSIKEPVRWRVFHRILEDIRARNANAAAKHLQTIIDEAVREVRAERRTKGTPQER